MRSSVITCNILVLDSDRERISYEHFVASQRITFPSNKVGLARCSLHYTASYLGGAASTRSSNQASLVHQACSRPRCGHFRRELRIHAISLPVGFCSSDAVVLLQRATSNSAGAVEPDADAFELSSDQRSDEDRPVIFSCPHWPPGSAPRQRGPAIFRKSFPTNRNVTDRSVR